MLLCLHEEQRGRDRARLCEGHRPRDGRGVHSNVGLMHATMAIFNAWCDRMPLIVLGATGPVDAAEAPALDRLDPHLTRSGRAGSRLCQMGRSAGFAGAARESLLRAR